MTTRTTTKRTASKNSTPAAKVTRARKLSGAALQASQAKAHAAKVELWTGLITTVAMIGIGAIAFLASYQELRDLCIIAGKSADHWWSTANLIPIGIDLMLIIASLRLRRKGITRTARIIARISSLAGLLLSLAGNVVHGWWHNVPSATSANYLLTITLVVSAVPVASLLASTEMLTHTHKDVSIVKARKASEAPATMPQAPATPVTSTSTPPVVLAPWTPSHQQPRLTWNNVRAALVPSTR